MRRDSAGAAGGGGRAPHAAGALGAGARGDTAATPKDTAEVRRLLAERPVPFDKVVLRFAPALAPETRYVIRVHGAVNLNGATGDGQVVVLMPKRVAPDTTSHAPRPTPSTPPPPKR